MERLDTQRQRLRSLFGIYFAPEITGTILPLARPALRLGGEGHAHQAGVRLGGDPLLPPGTGWPTWDGRPLDFLGAVDFAVLASVMRVPDLPAGGRAAFYYASDIPRPWGDDPAQRDGWRVCTGPLEPATPPPGPEPFPVRRLAAAPFLSLPAPQEPVVTRLDAIYNGILIVYEQVYAAWLQHVWPDEPVHQAGGWPAPVQRPIGPDCHLASAGRDMDAARLSPDEAVAAGDEWRLLLQLDSDPRVGWHWGDPGRLYYSTRATTLPHQAWLTLQSR